MGLEQRHRREDLQTAAVELVTAAAVHVSHEKGVAAGRRGAALVERVREADALPDFINRLGRRSFRLYALTTAMEPSYRACAAGLFVAASLTSSAAPSERFRDPLRFFEGRTESVSTIKVVMKKPFRSRSIGRGEIKPDGSLYLVQHVEEDGRPPHDRRWQIRQVASGRFAGTMSEANGPVTIEEIEGRYRFRYKMKGGLSVEQWMTPLSGGRSAQNKLTIRKFGVTVARSEGVIRKAS
jgi:hypothetical protein